MISEKIVQMLNVLSSSSFMWGPFFFSLLFMLFITRKSHIYLQNVMTRTDPPAEKDEKVVYRRYFFSSVVSGIVLVFISVGWWIYAQMQIHAFEGVFVGLETNQYITAKEDDVYLRPVQRDVGHGNQIRDYHFAIVRESPFSPGQVFHFNFYPEPGSIGNSPPDPVNITVPYSGRASDKYMLKKEGSSFVLTCLSNGAEE